MGAIETERLVNDNLNSFADLYGNKAEKLLDYIDRDISKLYSRYADKGSMTYKEALEFLSNNENEKFKVSLKEYQAMCQDNEYLKNHRLEVLALGLRARISRLEYMKAKILMETDKFFIDFDKDFKEQLGSVGETAYNDKLEEIGQKIKLQDDHIHIWSNPNVGVMKELLEYPWSGKNYSQKIWGNCENFESMLNSELSLGLVTGTPYDKIVSNMSKKCNNERGQIERLVKTEGNFIMNQSQLTAYEDNNIKEYEYLAIIDQRTSPICTELNGKRFKIKEAVVGENYPPMHPYCRSTTLAVIERR